MFEMDARGRARLVHDTQLPPNATAGPGVGGQAGTRLAAPGTAGRKAWFPRSRLSKSDDKVPIVMLPKYYTYNRQAVTVCALHRVFLQECD